MPVNILIVDDNRDLADGLSAVLETEGYQPIVCYNGDDAIKMVKQQRFDICLVDVKLPDTNGVELFRQIISLQPEARVILMTGYRIDQLLSEANQHREVMLFRQLPDSEELIQSIEKVGNGGIILLTDNTPDIVAIIENNLASYNWSSAVINNEKSLKALRLNKDPNQVIVDLSRPVIYSLDTHLSLLEEGLNHPMIIVASESSNTDVIDPLRSISVTGCLFKPFDTEFVLRALRKLLSEKNPDYPFRKTLS